MELITCRGCGEPVVGQSSRCWRCGHPVIDALSPPSGGLGMAAQVVVIASVFALLLFGMVALTQRQEAVAEWASASARAVAVAEQERADAERRAAAAADRAGRTQTPVPAPDAGGAGTYTAQPGDSLFSVAAALGVSPNELVYWNKDVYPTLQSTPALTPGWVLATAGPPLPTAPPRPTPTPRPIAPATPPPQVAGPGTPVLPSFGPGSFPASASVTVSYYAVSGSTPQQVHASIQENGPWSDWLGRNAQAHVQASPSFNFAFRSDGYGCAVVPTGGDFVTITYRVVLPTWAPPTDVSQRTIDWWIETIHDTVAHEGHHITLYEAYRPLMHDAVRTGTCASVPADLERIFTDAKRANCEFDLAEYGYALGLTLESCLMR